MGKQGMGQTGHGAWGKQGMGQTGHGAWGIGST